MLGLAKDGNRCLMDILIGPDVAFAILRHTLSISSLFPVMRRKIILVLSGSAVVAIASAAIILDTVPPLPATDSASGSNLQPPRIVLRTPSASPSATPSIAFTPYADPQGRFSIGIPPQWTTEALPQSDEASGVVLHQPLGASIRIVLSPALLDPTLDQWLQERDQRDQTSYEGRPGKKILSTRRTTVDGRFAVERIEEWLAAGLTTVSTYLLDGKTAYVIELVPSSELAGAELRALYAATVGTLSIRP